MVLVQGSIRRAAAAMGRIIIDTVYPKTCVGCGMRGCWVCDLCEAETLVLAVPGMCQRCGIVPLNGRCSCRDLAASVSMARSFAAYEGWVGRAVHRVKYDGEPDRARHLASILGPMLTSFGAVDGLIPVPLHPSKQRARGFNQSALLAQHLSAETGVLVVDVLRRTVNTVSQTTLSERERRQNVANAFSIDPTWAPRPGQRFVLVDDVWTTGATLGACAEVLSSVSPASIGVLTFAKDLYRDDLAAYRDYLRGIRSGGNPTP